jgi:tetratricopeptide (TPR) repeat protein
MRSLRPLAVAATLSLLLATPPVRAQTDDATRSAARTLAEAGLALQASGDDAGALVKFERALALVEVPTLAVLSARCLVKLGRLVEAAERYRQARAMTVDSSLASGYRAAQLEAQADAEKERAALLPRIPVLDLALEGASPQDVELRIDEQRVPSAIVGVDRPIDPGRHRVQARRGAEVVTQEPALREGERMRVTLVFKPIAALPPPPPPPSGGERPGSTQRIVGAVIAGLGGATLVAGGVNWALALGKKGDLDKVCPGEICPPSAKDTLDTYTRLRTTAIAMMVTGGVLAGAGVVTIAVAPRGAPARAAITPWIGPLGAGVRGTF